jgi:HK97 family phage major capsid protein
MTHLDPIPESKSAPDVAGAFDEFLRAFEAYKQGNDERVAAIERRAGDVLHDEKVARIGSALDAQKQVLDELLLKGRRPAFGREEKMASAAELEHGKAFDAYVRHGEASGLKRLEAKALSVGSGADGGYLVPEQTEREIGRRLVQVSPVRAWIATIRPRRRSLVASLKGGRVLTNRFNLASVPAQR